MKSRFEGAKGAEHGFSSERKHAIQNFSRPCTFPPSRLIARSAELPPSVSLARGHSVPFPRAGGPSRFLPHRGATTLRTQECRHYPDRGRVQWFPGESSRRRRRNAPVSLAISSRERRRGERNARGSAENRERSALWIVVGHQRPGRGVPY